MLTTTSADCHILTDKPLLTLPNHRHACTMIKLTFSHENTLETELFTLFVQKWQIMHQQQPRKPQRRRGMQTPDTKAPPKSSQDHSNFATNWKHPTHQTQPVKTRQRRSSFCPVQIPQNVLQILKTGRQESEQTYLAGKIERVTPQTSEWSEQPHPVWSNVNQVLTSYVLLDLMIV